MENSKTNDPVIPVELSLKDKIQFRCHKKISCFNLCCQSIDIVLTPYDIIRLKERLGIDSQQFLTEYTTEFEMDMHGIPGVKLKPMSNSNVCPFVKEAGCSIYEDRPTVCRYYPIGNMGLRRQDSKKIEDIFFLVKEEHCKGHEEQRSFSIKEYLEEQNTAEFDVLNSEWREIIIKKRSAGPLSSPPAIRSLQLFHLASYNLDHFLKFILSAGFQQAFELDKGLLEKIKNNSTELLRFAIRYLKQVLFGEMTIPLKKNHKKGDNKK